MTPRLATIADIPALVEMGEHFLTDTAYGGFIRSNRDQMRVLLEHLITTLENAVFVTASQEQLTGMIGLCAFAHPISGERTASEVFWWAEPNHRGHGLSLLRIADAWARAQGATLLQMIAPTEGVETIYRRFGFTKTEVLYQRRLA